MKEKLIKLRGESAKLLSRNFFYLVFKVVFITGFGLEPFAQLIINSNGKGCRRKFQTKNINEDIVPKREIRK